MKLSKFLPVIGLAGFLTAACAAEQKVEFSPKKSFARVNVARRAIAVDGKISKGEYFGSYENFGLLKHNNPFLSSRQGSFFAALDDNYLYLAMRSELPDADSKVSLLTRYKRRDSRMYADDGVEFLFYPPQGKFVYHIIANSANYTYDYKYPVTNGGVTVDKKINWNPDIEVKSSFDKKYWTVELSIPLKDIGIEKLQSLSKWKMQFGRSWRNPSQQCGGNQVLYFIDPGEMLDVEFVQSTPNVRFITLGDKYLQGKNNIVYTIDNPTPRPQKIKYSVAIVSEAAPRSKEGVLTVPAGKSADVVLDFDESSKVNNDLKAVFFNELGKVIYNRNFYWAYPGEKRWVAPDAKNSADFEFGIYPYFNKVRARLGNQSVPYDMRRDVSAVMFITDEKGKTVSKKYTPQKNDNAGYSLEMPLNLNSKGFYYLVAEIKKQDGKTETFKQKFEFDKFEWEHNKLGCDRVVLPPYKDLQYGSNTVKTLMSQYTVNNGFFSQIKSGRAENLLAAPITLKVNAKSPEFKDAKWLEKSADYGVYVTSLALDNVKFEVKNEFEFDNFVKTTLSVDPGKGFDFKSMTLDIPLKGEIAKRIHSTCNRMRYNFAHALEQKEGEIWNSAMGALHSSVFNNFRPYIWVGDIAEGLAFFAESDKNWSRDPKKSMAQIIRKGDTATLRINFADMPSFRNKPFEIVFGFQATPTRGRPNVARSFNGRGNAPNSLVTSVLAGSKCWSGVEFDFTPYKGDYSFLNALRQAKNKKRDKEFEKKIVTGFMEKNCKDMTKDQWKNFENHLYRGLYYSSISKYIVPYLNPRATHFRWPSYRVFMDEWFCSEYRAFNEDAYNTTPCKSYQDYVMYLNNKLLDEGLDGIYYDNIRDWNNPNIVTGPAYVLPGGKIQPYFDIFDMRELIKRTAVLLYKKGRTIFDGRPLLYLHMTNTNLIPFTSLCGITLECEAHYGSDDFQNRFSEDYLKCSVIGAQSGAIPEVLIKITGNNLNHVTRTFVATILAYDINSVMTAGGVVNIFYKTMYNLRHFGYGTDSVEVYPSYAPSGTFKTDADVRITEYRRNDGITLVAVSSFGYQGKVKLSWNYDARFAHNWENSRKLQLNDKRSVEFDLKKNDFQIVKITK